MFALREIIGRARGVEQFEVAHDVGAAQESDGVRARAPRADPWGELVYNTQCDLT